MSPIYRDGNNFSVMADWLLLSDSEEGLLVSPLLGEVETKNKIKIIVFFSDSEEGASCAALAG